MGTQNSLESDLSPTGLDTGDQWECITGTTLRELQNLTGLQRAGLRVAIREVLIMAGRGFLHGASRKIVPDVIPDDRQNGGFDD